MQLNAVLDAVDAEVQQRRNDHGHHQHRAMQRPRPALTKILEERPAAAISRDIRSSRSGFRSHCCIMPVGLAYTGGGDTGNRIHACGNQKRQPWPDAIQKPPYRASGHIHRRISSFVETAGLRVVAHVDDRFEHGVGGAPQESVDRRRDHCNREQYGISQSARQQQSSDGSPAQHAHHRVDDNQRSAVMSIDICATKDAEHLLRDHRCGAQPSCRDRGAGNRISDQGDRQGTHRHANCRRRIRSEPSSVVRSPPESHTLFHETFSLLPCYHRMNSFVWCTI